MRQQFATRRIRWSVRATGWFGVSAKPCVTAHAMVQQSRGCAGRVTRPVVQASSLRMFQARCALMNSKPGPATSGIDVTDACEPRRRVEKRGGLAGFYHNGATCATTAQTMRARFLASCWFQRPEAYAGLFGCLRKRPFGGGGVGWSSGCFGGCFRPDVR